MYLALKYRDGAKPGIKRPATSLQKESKKEKIALRHSEGCRVKGYIPRAKTNRNSDTVTGLESEDTIPDSQSLSELDPSVTHCILGKPDQFRVTCPSIRKSNISQSAYYAKNTQYLSAKRRHLGLTSVHPSTLFFNKRRRNRRLFTTSAEIWALLFMGKYVYNAKQC